jgi:hypothetical protein
MRARVRANYRGVYAGLAAKLRQDDSGQAQNEMETFRQLNFTGSLLALTWDLS